MIKQAILKMQKETGLNAYDIMSAYIYGTIWGLVVAGSIYPVCWLIEKIAEMFGRI